MKTIETERMSPVGPETNPVEASIHWSAGKSVWYSLHLLLGLLGVLFFFDWVAMLVCGALTVITLCCGHTVGLHRLLIHRNLCCPRWLERTLVYLGTLVGMGGAFGMIYLHDIRDWAQRHHECHPFFTHQSWIGKDWWWNLHCGISLENAPVFVIEADVAEDPLYRILQKTWMAQQIPLAVLLFLAGGWGFVLWGICARIALSLTGHWLIGHFAHNYGQRDWHLHGHAVQGFNLPGLGLLTMGESWHNNHHAYPDSARLGIEAGQADPGWWFVMILEKFGLAREIRTPENLPDRPERKRITIAEDVPAKLTSFTKKASFGA
ncbi:MAG: acyl-CoA desaturase [Verrucomicrobiales bacterium]|nr:acyl-CoA desaturase [Verrucomicrobiales bacterium]